MLASFALRKTLPKIELICIDRFRGIKRFTGLGQLTPQQLASLWPKRKRVGHRQLIDGAIDRRQPAGQHGDAARAEQGGQLRGCRVRRSKTHSVQSFAGSVRAVGTIFDAVLPSNLLAVA